MNNAGKVVRKLFDVEKTRQSYLAERLGITRYTLHSRLVSKNPTIESLCEIIDALGYEMVIRPKRGSGASGGVEVIEYKKE